jgi:hypothetical protein
MFLLFANCIAIGLGLLDMLVPYMERATAFCGRPLGF